MEQVLPLKAETVPETISLKGKWYFSLDTLKAGLDAGWFQSRLSDTIFLPGTTDENKKGRINNRRESGRLTRVYPYYGPAWYQKEVEVKADSITMVRNRNMVTALKALTPCKAF